jgi:hypothetical protein
MSRRVKLRSAGKITGKRHVVAYKRAVAKHRGQRERSIGVGGHDAASKWLAMSPAERQALSDGEVRAMLKERMPLG